MKMWFNDKPVLQFMRVLPHDLPIPSYATPGSAGMDICSRETTVVSSKNIAMVSTGWAVAIPEGYELQCRPRSGLASKGIMVSNSPGTIDSDYRGEIKVLIYNTTNNEFRIMKGDRIAQLILAETPKLPIVEVTELDTTSRGAGGFGSTGRN